MTAWVQNHDVFQPSMVTVTYRSQAVSLGARVVDGLTTYTPVTVSVVVERRRVETVVTVKGMSGETAVVLSPLLVIPHRVVETTTTSIAQAREIVISGGNLYYQLVHKTYERPAVVGVPGLESLRRFAPYCDITAAGNHNLSAVAYKLEPSSGYTVDDLATDGLFRFDYVEHQDSEYIHN
jgi:hypothetical protein